MKKIIVGCLVLAVAGCSFNIDVNGYYSKRRGPEKKMCLVQVDQYYSKYVDCKEENKNGRKG